MKLRAKVFTIFVIIAVVPLMLLTNFAYNRYVQTTYQRMDEFSSHLFENAMEVTNNTLSTICQTAELFTLYPDIGFSVPGALEQFSDPDQSYDPYEVLITNQNIKFICQNAFFSYDYIYGIYIITPSGITLGHSIGKNGDICQNYDAADEKWYKETLELNGELYVSNLDNHDLFTGVKSSVFFSQKLENIYSHEFLGVLIIDCDPKIFDLSLVNTMPDITLLTLDNSKTNSVLYTNIDELEKNFANGSEKHVMKTSLNVEPLQLTAVFDYKTLASEFNVTAMSLLLIALACTIGIILLSYVVSKNLVYPIEHLSQKMASQKGHTLFVSSRYLDRTDEIGTLYNEYNSMVSELNTSIKRDYQDKLILLDAQMKSLEARINSHFLFNTLESINSMAELADNEQIATMSLSLGNMFRYTIKTQSELVTVQEELNHVQDYISIQQIRFNNKFRLIVDMDDSFKQEKILKLILQPLVENALYHGLKYCTVGDTISICGRIEQNCLYISVRDNGQGIDSDRIQLIQDRLHEEASFTELGHRNKESIGLKNIHSRIELYYGRGYGLNISSKAGQWTEIRIKLPVMRKENLS